MRYPLQERHFPAYHYAMQKNSSCAGTEKSYLCKVLHFNRQNVMLIDSPNGWATVFGSY